MLHTPLNHIWKESRGYTMTLGPLGVPDEFTKPIAIIFGYGAYLDNMRSDLMLLFMGGEVDATIEVYFSLRGAALSALKAAAKVKLNKFEYQVFEATLKTADKFITERNKFAHWIWGQIDTLPDRICLLDPKLNHKTHATLVKTGEQLEKGEIEYEEYAKLNSTDIRYALVHTYSLEQLKEIRWEAIRAHGAHRELEDAINRSGLQRDAKFLELKTRLSSR